MQASTSVRVSRETHAALRALAAENGVSLDDQIARLIRAERQRRMGLALAAHAPDSEERAWLDLAAEPGRHDAIG